MPTLRWALIGCALIAADGCAKKEEDKVAMCDAARKAHVEFNILSNCYELGPSQKLRGVWRVGFESDKFVADSQAPDSNPFLDASLIVKDASACPPYSRYGAPTKFRVQFVGRQVHMPDLPYPAFVVAKIEECTAV